MSNSSEMKLSEFIKILNGVKKMYGDLLVWGECEECGASDLYVWTLTSNQESWVTIQVSGNGEDKDY
jgi:hypothetical protein